MILPVILSGGSGSRLWPLSRQQRPKQFLPIVEDLTLFQATLQRLKNLADVEAPLIVCNEEHRFMVAEQLRELDQKNQGILLEPIGRNTAPAIALAALLALEQNSNAILLILPADHVISDIASFHAAIHTAYLAAQADYLVTFGIVPTHPETGYGYIQSGTQLTEIGCSTATQVLRFVEKPDSITAEHYLSSGEYLWNSGMFLFKASVYLNALEQYQPTVLETCQSSLKQKRNDGDFIRLDAESFEKCPDISIDYAVMEKTTQAAVVPLAAGWNDVGAWLSVWDIGKKDVDGNVERGRVKLHNAQNNLIYSEQRLIALVGVENIIVIDTKDATLVVHKEHVQDVKKIVDNLKANECVEAILHREVNRPWGSYDSLDAGERFQVKRIVVKPGAKLSLQKHHHRAEHWIIVKGTAEVTCDERTFLLTENQSTYIPLGSMHRLANPGKVPLELIEVQSGSYLGEDDIVRFEDQYGR